MKDDQSQSAEQKEQKEKKRKDEEAYKRALKSIPQQTGPNRSLEECQIAVGLAPRRATTTNSPFLSALPCI